MKDKIIISKKHLKLRNIKISKGVKIFIASFISLVWYGWYFALLYIVFITSNWYFKLLLFIKFIVLIAVCLSLNPVPFVEMLGWSSAYNFETDFFKEYFFELFLLI